MKDKMIRILNTIIGKLEDSRNSRQEVINYIKIKRDELSSKQEGKE
jgi:hypothetical protein